MCTIVDNGGDQLQATGNGVITLVSCAIDADDIDDDGGAVTIALQGRK